MIKFRSSVDKTEHRVIFEPRPGTSLGAKEIHRKLLYGYRCGFCDNAILFAFLTPAKVPLKRYEISRVVNGLQEFHLVIPGEHTPYQTAYHSDFTPVPGSDMGVQHVYMQNHVLRQEKIGSKDAAHEEKRPRCCPYTAVFGLRPDLLIKDTLLMGGVDERELSEYDLPSWSQFKALIVADELHGFMDGIGGLPLVMVRSDFIADRKGLSLWRKLLIPFKKKPKVQVSGLVPDSESEEGLALEGLPVEQIAGGTQQEDADGNRVGLGTVACEYCTGVDCNFGCDESQAGGFTSESAVADLGEHGLPLAQVAEVLSFEDDSDEPEDCDDCGGYHRPSVPCDDIEIDDEDFDDGEDEDED